MRGGMGGGMRGGMGGGMRGGMGGGMRGGMGGGMRGGGFNTFRGGFFHQPVRGNFGFNNFNRFRFNNRFSFNRFGFFSPFAFPAFSGDVGFYGGPSFGSFPYAGDSYGYQSAGYSDSGPGVIIVQDSPNVYSYVQAPDYSPPAAPVLREYVSPPSPQGSYEQPLYLMAFQDGSIRAVLAYWVEGTGVHYITMDHEQKQATLASVDRALSERLNRERNVPFRLPPAR
jgi:hypothetical protein